MFERYTDGARRVILFARYEASQFGASTIYPEHMLLGVLREKYSPVDRLLKDAGISRELVIKEITTRSEVGGPLSTAIELPLTPETKRVLAFAHEEAERLESRHIGVDHILLGILREASSLAAEVLHSNGISLDLAREVAVVPYIDIDIAAEIDQAEKTSAKALGLSALGMTKLPETLSRLRKLRWLDLSRNKLTTLPDWINRLTELSYLDLSNNLLTSLPDTLLSLRSLETLFLHGNPSLPIPIEILGPTHDDVKNGARPAQPAGLIEFYNRVQSGSRALNEAKLLLVGRGAVGKTSIVNRLVYDQFDDEKKTEGIQITSWHLRLNGDELVRLNIWDFGGQEIMHATHQFFFTRRSLYLLVITGREGGEDTDAEYWLKLIESFGGESPVIVVLNKIKEHSFDVNRRALQQKYPIIRDFIKTDCSDGTGIDLLRKAVERETDRLEHLRDSFPESWFIIKSNLSGMEANYLSFDEYRGECLRLGEGNHSAQESLSSYLHSLGVVLNYKDDPRLQDTHVLNPHWVTNGIYKILNSDVLEKRKGEIWLRDLSEILDSMDYPVRMHRFLFDLMKKFELCFSFPDDDCHYLVPELLDKQESDSAASFDPKECLNFQYHYPVLPEGLLPRFIVRTHALSEGLPRWRTGVILQFEGNEALVKGDVHDKRVYISVRGPKQGRRRLLAVIRSDFEHIHRHIHNLHPQEMIPLPAHPDVVLPFNELLVLERNGMKSYPKVVGDQIINFDVNELLNGVDLDVTSRRGVVPNERSQAVQLFYSYSHRDERLRDELETHLKLLQRQGVIKAWHDRKLEAGSEWKEKIDENLERADIILLLVSADFIASDYCYEKEMKRALGRQAKGEAQVIPVILRDVNWSAAPFSDLQVLPRDGLPVTKWEDRDSAWRNVSEGIGKVAEMLQRI